MRDLRRHACGGVDDDGGWSQGIGKVGMLACFFFFIEVHFFLLSFLIYECRGYFF